MIGAYADVDDPSKVQQALDWINAKARHFVAMGPRLDALEGRMLDVVDEANAERDYDRQMAAHNVVLSIDALHRHWADAKRRLQWLLSQVPGLGLGAWPVVPVVAAAALALAAWMSVLLHRELLVREAADAVADGQLTLEEARVLYRDVGGGGPSGPLLQIGGSGVLVAVAVIGGFFWLRSRPQQGGAYA